MATLKKTVNETYYWSLDRIYELCSRDDFEEVVNGDSIRQEFREWLDIEKESHVLSLEYIDDADSGVYSYAANQLGVSTGGTGQVAFTDGVILPVTNNDIDLGSDDNEFKNAWFDGTVEADAYTVAGTALNEYIADTVGAMVSGNTETNITVTYEDGDNTLDFVVAVADDFTRGPAFFMG